MARSAPSTRKALAHPYAIECSLATPTTSAFAPFRTGRGMSTVMMDFRSMSGEHATRVPGDHQFFVGRDDPRGDAASRDADSRIVAAVGRCVEVDAQPGRVLADPLAQAT